MPVLPARPKPPHPVLGEVGGHRASNRTILPATVMHDPSFTSIIHPSGLIDMNGVPKRLPQKNALVPFERDVPEKRPPVAHRAHCLDANHPAPGLIDVGNVPRDSPKIFALVPPKGQKISAHGGRRAGRGPENQLGAARLRQPGSQPNQFRRAARPTLRCPRQSTAGWRKSTRLAGLRGASREAGGPA